MTNDSAPVVTEDGAPIGFRDDLTRADFPGLAALAHVLEALCLRWAERFARTFAGSLLGVFAGALELLIGTRAIELAGLTPLLARSVTVAADVVALRFLLRTGRVRTIPVPLIACAIGLWSRTGGVVAGLLILDLLLPQSILACRVRLLSLGFQPRAFGLLIFLSIARLLIASLLLPKLLLPSGLFPLLRLIGVAALACIVVPARPLAILPAQQRIFSRLLLLLYFPLDDVRLAPLLLAPLLLDPLGLATLLPLSRLGGFPVVFRALLPILPLLTRVLTIALLILALGLAFPAAVLVGVTIAFPVSVFLAVGFLSEFQRRLL